jgi:pimeloyl-ACP methyl ester carboxylesterase
MHRISQRCVVASIYCLIAILPELANAAPPPGIPDGWSDGYAYANGVRLHYYHAVPAPGKPVIVMAHGVTDNGLCFANVSLKLQDAYDIYMLDTRGHGLSDPYTSSDDGSTLVKDVVEFVRAMKFEKPILMGHSMGAATVMRVGAEYPDLAKAIIMLDPGLGRGGPGGRRGAGPATAPTTNAARAARRGAAPTTQARGPATPDRLSINMFGDPETLVKQNNYSFDDLVATGRRENPKWDISDVQYWALSKKQYHGPYSNEARQAMTGTMGTGDALAKISVPALILKADAPLETRKANEEAAKVMQKGKIVHIDGAAHNLHHDNLKQTIEVMNEYLATLK